MVRPPEGVSAPQFVAAQEGCGAGVPGPLRAAAAFWGSWAAGVGLQADGPAAGPAKPVRGFGPTMVIDKGVSAAAFRDLLRTGAPFVRWWKLGFGTAALYPPQLVQQKVSRGRRLGVDVYVGGTFLELARVQGQLEAALQALAGLSVRWVEISDGTFPLAAPQRERLIQEVAAMGFQVLTEVGSKREGMPWDASRTAEQVARDLACGAAWVLIEARDSGRGVGVFDAQGGLCRDRVEQLVAALEREGVDLGRVVWEAPLPEQQKELLLWFGPGVALGNVQVTDILQLAAMRAGLRSDTLRAWWRPGRDPAPSVDGGPAQRVISNQVK